MNHTALFVQNCIGRRIRISEAIRYLKSILDGRLEGKNFCDRKDGSGRGLFGKLILILLIRMMH